MKRLIYPALILLCVMLLFCGCSGDENESLELNMSLANSPSTIDPQLCGDTGSAMALSFTAGTLYEYDEEGELIPELASGYEVSDDGCTYTFHLKKGLKWSDGSPIIADDFVYAFQRLSDPDTGSNSVYLVTDSCRIKNIDAITRGDMASAELGVRAPDDETFIVELEEPCAFFCSLITRVNFAPCSRAFLRKVGDDFASSPDTVLSSGPYIMDRYEPIAKQIHYIPNPYYNDPSGVGLPGITLQVVANTQQAVMCYESDTLDVIPIGGEYLKLAEGDPELHVFPQATASYIALNQRDCPELKNKNIRLALTKSLDREKLAKNVMGAGYSPLYSTVPPDFYKEEGNKDFEEDGKKYEKYCGYDPEGARKLWETGLKELGVTGFSIEFLYNSNQGYITEALADQMKECLPGLDIKLQPVPFKEMLKRKAALEYDLVFSGWVADYVDPTTFLGLFVSTADYGCEDPVYDELYKKIQSREYVMDPPARDALMHQAEDRVMEEGGIITVFSSGSTYLINGRVSNFKLLSMGNLCKVSGITKEVR